MPVSVGIAIAASSVATYVGTTLAMGMIVGAVAGALTAMTLSAVFRPSAPEMDTSGMGSSLAAQQASILVTTRQAAAPWMVIYGQARVGGIITYMEATNSGLNLQIVITLAGHEVDEIGDIYFDDELVPLSGNDATGRFANYAQVYKSLGDEAAGVQPFANLVTLSAGLWTSAHCQTGCAKIWVNLHFNADLFPNGIPNITAVVKGKKVYDPRSATTDWSDNPALCIADYLCDTRYGLDATLADEIDADQLTAAANTCDERVRKAATTLGVSFSASTDLAHSADFGDSLLLGSGVRFATTGVLPAGLNTSSTFYVIPAGESKYYVTTSVANAAARVYLDFTDAGTGDHTMIAWDEARYTMHGAFSSDATPRDTLGKMLTSCAGRVTYVGGSWFIIPAVYAAPTVTLTADDLRGPVHIQPRLSRRDLCNGVKGVYVSPDAFWQPTDFPPVDNATYLTEDQEERIWLDLDLPYTKSALTAQRIAKIELERARQQITVSLPCKLSAWQVQPGDTVAVTLSRYGYSSKVFEVMEATLVSDEDGSLGVDLILRETASTVFDWSSGEETVVDSAPDSELPDPFADLTITPGTPASGTDELFVQGDGVVVSRIRLPFTPGANPFVSHYELQFARSSGSPQEWQDAPALIAGGTANAFYYPVEDGVSYDLRIRAVTSIGNRGDYAYARGHTVVGKTAAPSDVTGASAVQTGGTVVMGCDSVDDADLYAVEVRLQDEGETSWDDGSPVANILRGQTITSAAIPPGTWELLFKAKDNSGNYSANAVQVSIVVTADGFTTVYSEDEAPDWLGSMTNMVRHWTGVLTPESQNLASDDDWETFDEFVPNAYEDCYYEAPVIDKSIDATARIYGDIVSVLGPGETTGIASPSLEVDHRVDAGSFDGFEAWTVGSVNFRHAKFRIYVDTTIGKPVISAFTPSIDALSRTETGTYTTPAGGSVAVTFATAFHSTPIGTVSPQGSGDVTASYASLTAEGFTGYFKTGGAAGAGTASYSFTGA
jgi:hypothetical protein